MDALDFAMNLHELRPMQDSAQKREPHDVQPAVQVVWGKANQDAWQAGQATRGNQGPSIGGAGRLAEVRMQPRGNAGAGERGFPGGAFAEMARRTQESWGLK